MTGTGPSPVGGGALAPDAAERAFSYAKDVLRRGMPREKVEEVLRAQGFDPATASAIVQQADGLKNERRNAGKRHMITGAIFCVAGIIITAVSYSAAAEGGGGTYVVTWGAIIFGGIQFFRGLIQYSEK